MDILQKQRKWANAWQTAAGSLKKLKKDELRADDYYEKNQKILDEMLQYACDSGLKRGGSGLVEQQRIFKNAVAPGKIERMCHEESGGNPQFQERITFRMTIEEILKKSEEYSGI